MVTEIDRLKAVMNEVQGGGWWLPEEAAQLIREGAMTLSVDDDGSLRIRGNVTLAQKRRLLAEIGQIQAVLRLAEELDEREGESDEL